MNTIYYPKKMSIFDEMLLNIKDIFAGDSGDSERWRRMTFQKILEENTGMISRICFGFTNSREEFDDLRQDILATIWESLPRFRGESLLSTWVYRVALNTCVATVRKHKPETVRLSADEFHDIVDTSDEQISKLSEIHDAISELSYIDRSILLMWLDGVTYEEISVVAGLPRNTVATRLRRARERLKSKFNN